MVAVGNGDGARGQQKQAEKNLGCLPRSAKFIVYSLTLQNVGAIKVWPPPVVRIVQHVLRVSIVNALKLGEIRL